MGEGYQKAHTEAKLSRVPAAKLAEVKAALARECPFRHCRAKPGLWCTQPAAGGVVLSPKLHLSRSRPA